MQVVRSLRTVERNHAVREPRDVEDERARRDLRAASLEIYDSRIGGSVLQAKLVSQVWELLLTCKPISAVSAQMLHVNILLQQFLRFTKLFTSSSHSNGPTFSSFLVRSLRPMRAKKKT